MHLSDYRESSLGNTIVEAELLGLQLDYLPERRFQLRVLCNFHVYVRPATFHRKTRLNAEVDQEPDDVEVIRLPEPRGGRHPEGPLNT